MRWVSAELLLQTALLPPVQDYNQRLELAEVDRVAALLRTPQEQERLLARRRPRERRQESSSDVCHNVSRWC
jgi:hypothetical protein